jgi:hypothetical protein
LLPSSTPEELSSPHVAQKTRFFVRIWSHHGFEPSGKQRLLWNIISLEKLAISGSCGHYLSIMLYLLNTSDSFD